MKILVMGAGSIGSLFAGLLACNNENDVTIVAREFQVKAVKSYGLKIKGLIEKTVKNIKAETSVQPLIKEAWDLILLTVKAYSVSEASKQISPLIKEKTMVLCLQNGIGVEDEVLKVIRKENIIRGVTFCGAFLEKPGIVVSTGFGKTILGGLSQKNYDNILDIAENFKNSGFYVEISDNIQSIVWTKTLVNAGINPYGTLTGMRNGELLEYEDLKLLIAETVLEGVRVADKLKIPLPEDPVDLTFKTAKATAENFNSMLQDIKRGRRTEIDYINGAISRLGSSTGVSTPLNMLLTFLVKRLEKNTMVEELWRRVIHQKIS
ncbi:2-dehydropantoate 2-reductase [Candidatus Bathyarchaeota archaeon]|nr:MAG: 2-dehydropantoate 2-reductase [Candidatus Bathyarchaeota archaeon]